MMVKDWCKAQWENVELQLVVKEKVQVQDQVRNTEAGYLAEEKYEQLCCQHECPMQEMAYMTTNCWGV